MSGQFSEIPIDRIAIDPALQARVSLDEGTLKDYEHAATQSLQDGNQWPFPAVTMVGGFLIDGHHRYEVAKRLGRSTILADQQPGDEDAAVRAAVSANANHGLRRSREDVQRAVSIAFGRWPGKSARAVARIVGCSPQTVLNILVRDKDLAAAAGVQVGQHISPAMRHALKSRAGLAASLRYVCEHLEAIRGPSQKRIAEAERFISETNKAIEIVDGWIEREIENCQPLD